MTTHPAGICRFCKCTEANACKLPDGDPCAWFLADRTVCTAPACISAYFAARRNADAKADKAKRKRSPGTIHHLMQEERNARRRAQRARKKSEQRRSVA